MTSILHHKSFLGQYIMLILWILWALLLWISRIVVVIGARCGVCHCNVAMRRVVCAQRELSEVPIIPNSIKKRARVLLLQGNQLVEVDSEFIAGFPLLEYLDV
jgi:hypothetical protein